MKNFIASIFTVLFIFFCFSNSYSAMRFKSPRVKQPKQSYAKQIGGNAGQKTKIEYDRGGKYFSKTINGANTRFIPKDAKNIRVNGMRINQGERVTTTPKGATLFED